MIIKMKVLCMKSNDVPKKKGASNTTNKFAIGSRGALHKASICLKCEDLIVDSGYLWRLCLLVTCGICSCRFSRIYWSTMRSGEVNLHRHQTKLNSI